MNDASKHSVPSRPTTVLVIDDSKTIRRSARSLLMREGCEVVTAADGFEALARVVEHQPDLVFVDIMMPRLDGYQTCALIKSSADYSDTAVVMLSSKDSIFDKARGRVVGAEHYITKPFTRDDLVSILQRLVPQRAVVDQPADTVDADAELSNETHSATQLFSNTSAPTSV